MTQSVIRTGDFINSLGVASHLEDNAVGSQPYLVAAELSYIGLSNLRVEAPFNNLSTYVFLGEEGIKFDVITSSTDIPSQLSFFDSIAPYIATIEGPNEVNDGPFSYDNLSGPAAVEAFQADLYQAIKADPALTGIPVLSFSLSVGASEAGYNSVAAYADYGNLHAYTSGGGSPNQSIAYQQNLASLTPGEADYLTETGYYTLNDGNSGVSDAVQAIYLVDSVLDGAADGLVKTFLYELSDDPGDAPDDPEGNYGLFTASGQAKPAADAIHNLTTLLTDTGLNAATFQPAPQSISVTGLEAVNGFSQVFAKSSGEIDVALWAEPNLYDSATGVETIFSSPVTLSLGASYDVLVFDPIAGLMAIGSATDTTSFQVNLGDDPLIVELTPVVVQGATTSGIVLQTTSTAVTDALDGVWLDLTASKTASDDSALAVTSLGVSGTKGAVTLNPAATNGAWYSPGAAFAYLSVGETATDTFTFTVSDGHGGTATAAATVTITGVNQAPVVKDDAAATTASRAVSIGLLNGATDVNRDDQLSVTGLNTTGTRGSVTLGADGMASYTPGATFRYLAPGATATDSFGYTISDNHGASSTAIATVTITGVATPPVANPDSAVTTATSSGVWISAANNDAHAKGYTLAVVSVNVAGTRGTVTLNPAATNGVWYSPGKAFAYLNQGQTATDSFTYTISDGHGGTATATDTVTITGVAARPPVANPDQAAVTASASGVWINATGNDTDAAGYKLSVASVNVSGTRGTVTLNPTATNGVWYSPGTAFASLSAGKTALDTFSYTVSDGHGGTATAYDAVTITGVNQAPAPRSASERRSLRPHTGPLERDAGPIFTSPYDGQTSSESNVASIACYCRGTNILTNHGNTPVEDLALGDQVVTLTGELQPIRWIGRRSFSGRAFASNPAAHPVRFLAGSLGLGLPTRELMVSPEHAMFIDGVLVPAHCLVDGDRIAQAPFVAEVEYFHIELDEHAVIFAEGAPSETFNSEENRSMFSNAAEFAALYPGSAPKAGVYAPRVEQGPALEQIRRRLARLRSPYAHAA